jgi:hypothetical protein
MTLSTKMTFELRGNGGNLVGSEWIAAEGEIVDETPTDLELFLRRFGYTENQAGWSVRFHSPGGSLESGIRLGELIRHLKLNTEIGRTEPDEYGHWKRAPGYCASACAFAFIGGLWREASGGELGLHQFHRPISLRNPTAKLFTSLDLSEDQIMSAILIDYAFRMCVDPRFVSFAASTPPKEMRFLDEKEVTELKVRWFPKEFEPWSIEASGSGVVAITRSRDRTRTATFFYSADGNAIIVIEDEDTGVNTEWLASAYGVVDEVTAFDLQFPKTALKPSYDGGKLTLEFTLKGIDSCTVTRSKWCGVGVDGPRYMVGSLSYVLPRGGAENAIRVAIKNPL